MLHWDWCEHWKEFFEVFKWPRWGGTRMLKNWSKPTTLSWRILTFAGLSGRRSQTWSWTGSQGSAQRQKSLLALLWKITSVKCSTVLCSARSTANARQCKLSTGIWPASSWIRVKWTRVCWSVNCQIWVSPVWPQSEPKRTARPTLHPQKSRRCLWPQKILSLSRPKVLDPQKSRRCMRLSKILSLSRPKALLTSHLDVFLLWISASKWARSPEVVVESNFIGVVAQGCLRQHCHVISGSCRTHMWIPCEGTRTTISRTCKLRAKERSLLGSSFFPDSDLELNSNVKYLEV